MIRQVVLLGVLVAYSAACKSPEADAGEIRLGMTKAQLVAVNGEPDAMREVAANKRGQMEEIWEYTLAPEATTGRDVAAEVLSSGVGFFKDPTVSTKDVFHFIDGRLVSWGPETSEDLPE